MPPENLDDSSMPLCNKNEKEASETTRIPAEDKAEDTQMFVNPEADFSGIDVITTMYPETEKPPHPYNPVVMEKIQNESKNADAEHKDQCFYICAIILAAIFMVIIIIIGIYCRIAPEISQEHNLNASDIMKPDSSYSDEDNMNMLSLAKTGANRASSDIQLAVSAEGWTQSDLPFLISVSGWQYDEDNTLEYRNTTYEVPGDGTALDIGEYREGNYLVTITAAPMRTDGTMFDMCSSKNIEVFSDDSETVSFTSALVPSAQLTRIAIWHSAQSYIKAGFSQETITSLESACDAMSNEGIPYSSNSDSPSVYDPASNRNAGNDENASNSGNASPSNANTANVGGGGNTGSQETKNGSSINTRTDGTNSNSGGTGANVNSGAGSNANTNSIVKNG